MAVWGDPREDDERIMSDWWHGQEMIRVRRKDGVLVPLWDTLPDFIGGVAIVEGDNSCLSRCWATAPTAVGVRRCR